MISVVLLFFSNVKQVCSIWGNNAEMIRMKLLLKLYKTIKLDLHHKRKTPGNEKEKKRDRNECIAGNT